MATIWNCQGLTKIYSGKTLFREVNLALHEKDRLGMTGPNGSGKSTLLKIVAGFIEPDSGSLAMRKGLKIAYLAQSPDFKSTDTLIQVVLGSVASHYVEDYERRHQAVQMLTRFGFKDIEQTVGELSGGLLKRLALTQTLVLEPDLLLLDEPTNHLDLEGIIFLEEIIKTAPFTVAVISHDRAFLQSTMTRVVELNRIFPSGLFEVNGNYTDFLAKKDAFLTAQAQSEEVLANKVRRELDWLRAGVKARTTKSSARIQSAEELIADLAGMRERQQGQGTKIDFVASGRKTKKLVEAIDISKSFDGKKLFSDLSFMLVPGLRLGLLGTNGSGKSTLLKMIVKQLTPDQGRIVFADDLKIVYFDQMREHLTPEASVKEVLAPHGDSVIYNERPVHIASFAKRFGFRSEQLDTKVEKLSGGEKARLLIAKLMLQPADILLLDEPTNDLDIESLDALEESLLSFSGALVLVTHDRFLLNRVSTHILGFDGMGQASLYADSEQWQEAQKKANFEPITTNINASSTPTKAVPESSNKRKRLSYLEQREWDEMEKKIALAEQSLLDCQEALMNPSIASSSLKIQEASLAFTKAKTEVDNLYLRWAELESKLN